MAELPPGAIEIPRTCRRRPLWLTPDISSLLGFYASQQNKPVTDVGNRIILGFLSEHYGHENIPELRRRILKVIFPNKRAIYDALWSIARGKKPRRRSLPLRKHGKLPFSSSEFGSYDQDNP